MKKSIKKGIYTGLLGLLLCAGLSACRQAQGEARTERAAESAASGERTAEMGKDTESTAEEKAQMEAAGEPLDLTALSSTMVYSEVYNMVMSPERYIGREVTMEGEFSAFFNQRTGKTYFACIISDATACCAQGIEFCLREERIYPDDYPAIGEKIRVTGIFEIYEEEGKKYCRLRDAEMADGV